MSIKAVLFDVNGTLVDIRTDEGMEEIYRVLSSFLSYQGIAINYGDLRDLYFAIMDRQRKGGGEEFSEFDMQGIFRTILEERGTEYTRSLPPERLREMPLFLAQLYRAISLHYLKLYPGVIETLDVLRSRYRLAVVSDAQTSSALPELNMVGLLSYFNPIVVSSDCGYRKPDSRLFTRALDEMGIDPADAVFVGNHLFHDIHGARRAGIKTVFFASNHAAGKGEKPDYTIYQFPELLKAVAYLEGKSASGIITEYKEGGS